MRLRNKILLLLLICALCVFFLWDRSRPMARETENQSPSRVLSLSPGEPVPPEMVVIAADAPSAPADIPATGTKPRLPRPPSAGVAKSISQHLRGKKWTVGERSFERLDDVVALPPENAPRDVRPLTEANGFLIFSEADLQGTRVEGKRLVLFDPNRNNLAILTGQIQVTTDGTNLKIPSEFSLVQSFPHLSLYFLQGEALDYDQLSQQLRVAQALPGVVEAKIDMIETRFVEK